MELSSQTIIVGKEINSHWHNGTLGLFLAGADRSQINAVRYGYMLAHDVLEHQNGPEALGPTEEEFEALAAILYVRGAPTVESDISNVYQRRPRPVKKVDSQPLHSPEVETLLDAQLCQVKHLCSGETIKHIRNYMRIGYRKAMNRFPDQEAAIKLFGQMSSAIDYQILNQELIEGREWTMTYGIGHPVTFKENPCVLRN